VANRPAAISKKELTDFANLMQAANVPVWTVEIDRPDGTRIRLSAGGAPAPSRGAGLDKRLGITNG